MIRPGRQLLVLLACLLLVGTGVWLGGHPDNLPGFVRDSLVGDEEAHTIDDALEVIEDDFVRGVDRDRLVDDALRGAVERLNDRFSAYFSPEEYRRFQQSTEGEFSGIGVSVQEDRRGLRVVEVFDNSPAGRAGVRRGDVIVAVDGRSLLRRPQRVSTELIRGPEGTFVELGLVRRGERRTVRVRRERIDVPVVDGRLTNRDGNPLGIVSLAQFSSGAHGKLRARIDQQLEKGAKGLVFDLRGNGGGLLDEAVLVSSVFIENGTIVSTSGRSRPKRVFRAQGDAIPANIPVVVLVDRGSASASEIVAGALQDRERAILVGTRTFGKGVFQAVRQLPNGGALDLTVGRYFLPSGRNIGNGTRIGSGLKPDVRAHDREGTKRDEALNVALEELARRVRK